MRPLFVRLMSLASVWVFLPPPHSCLKDHGFVTVTVEVSNVSLFLSCCVCTFYCSVGNAMQFDCGIRRAVDLASVRKLRRKDPG